MSGQQVLKSDPAANNPSVPAVFATALFVCLALGGPALGVQESVSTQEPVAAEVPDAAAGPDGTEVPDGAVEPDAKAVFVSTLEAARAERAAAVKVARADYDRMSAALEAASAGLTPDARQRIVSGPLADARRDRDAALVAAEALHIQRVGAAVTAYGPAKTVYDSVVETIRVEGTKLTVFQVVMEVADSAASGAESAAGASARANVGRTRDHASLEANAERAKASYERAAEAYQETAGRRPKRIEPRKTGGENFGRFLDGLNSLAQGDRAAAERKAAEAGRARQAALDDAEAANARARAKHNAEVAEAREQRDAARSAYRAAAAAARGAAASAADAGTAREDAAETYSTTVAARRASFVNAAKVTRVYDALELEGLERSLRSGAFAAVAELEPEALAAITRDGALRALEGALAAYAEPRSAALSRLDRLEAEHAAASEDARLARVALESAESEEEGRIAAARNVLGGIQTTYLRAVRSADDALENVIVSTFRAKRPHNRRNVEERTGAAATHERAMEAARRTRAQSVARAYPSVFFSLRQRQYPVLTGLQSGSLGGVVSGVSRYKRARSISDSRYVEDTLAALRTRYSEGRGKLEADARSAARAQDRARNARDAAFSESQAATTVFDDRVRARLRVLEADVRRAIGALGEEAL